MSTFNQIRCITTKIDVPPYAKKIIALKYRFKGRVPRYKDIRSAEYNDPTRFDAAAAKLEFGPDYINQLIYIWRDRDISSRDRKRLGPDKLFDQLDTCRLPEIDMDAPKVDYQDVPALKNAPESVKKIFSVRFGDRKEIVQAWRKAAMDKVREHPLDDGTQVLKTKVAYNTISVRHLRKLLTELPDFRLQHLKRGAQMALISRKNSLNELLETNDDDYQQVIKALDIAHERALPIEDEPSSDRYRWCEVQCLQKAEEMKRHKMQEYHKELKELQPEFLRHKAQRLTALNEEETSLKAELEELRQLKNGGEIQVDGEFRGNTLGENDYAKMHDYYYVNQDKCDWKYYWQFS